MPGNYQFPEYLAANSVRAFPLAQAGSRLSDSGLKLPDSLIVSAAINATPDYVTGEFYVSTLVSLPDSVSIDLSFAPLTGDSRVVCRITAGSSHVENTVYSIIGSGEDAAVTGSITIGDLTETQGELAGTFVFGASATPFEGDCLFVSVAQVKYIELLNGTTSLGLFTDVLKLRAGRNIRLRYVGLDTIAIDAIDGLNLIAPDNCEQLPKIGDPIRTINGIAPDGNGNFNLDGSDCVSVEGITNGLSIADECASSCCGCSELQQLVTAQQQLEAQLQTVGGQISAVREQQTAMIVNLISRLP